MITSSPSWRATSTVSSFDTSSTRMIPPMIPWGMSAYVRSSVFAALYAGITITTLRPVAGATRAPDAAAEGSAPIAGASAGVAGSSGVRGAATGASDPAAPAPGASVGRSTGGGYPILPTPRRSAGRNGSFAKTEHVPVRIAEPGAAGRPDPGDEVDRLRALVVVERHTGGEEVADRGVDVADLEMSDRLTDVRLSAPNGHLAPTTCSEPDGKWLLVEDSQAHLVGEEGSGPIEIGDGDGGHEQSAVESHGGRSLSCGVAAVKRSSRRE